MNLSAPFIRRPVATSLLAAAILLAGAVAFRHLPVAPLPQVDFPTINVNANLPGASPETMASAVATPLERRFGRIAGVTEITSNSTLGSTSITLQFDLARDTTEAARDVQAAINAAGGELPPNLPNRPTYRKVNPADSPILILTLTSPTLPLAQIFDTANTVLAQKIAQVEGVGQVFVGGGQQPAVRVQIDPAVLAGMGLGSTDVRNALAASTANTPKGAIDGIERRWVLAANDQLFGAEQWRQILIAYRNGGSVALGDIAQVVDGVENNRVAAWSNGERAVLLIVRRQPGANILDTIDRVKALLPTLTASISPSIKVAIASDRALTIRGSVHEVEGTLVLSVVLVVLVVFAFLREGRATLIPTVAIPLSLVGTFGVMYLFGYSLDNLTLMALTIATGFVVDDAIVVTENVMRLLEEGHPPRKAALEGARQIGFTIVSITVSLVAVFIPILAMGGIVGRLFRSFAVTLSAAIIVSAVISLTVTPMMTSKLLRPHGGRPRGPLYTWSERGFQRLVDAYDRALGHVLSHPAITLLVAAATLGLTVYLFVESPKGLFPQQDTSLLTGLVQGPQDTSFAAMRARQEAVNRILRDDPDILNTVAFIGGGPGGSGNTGSMFVSLRPREERKASADEIIARLRPKLARVAGTQTFLQSAQDLRIGGRATRTQYQYALTAARLDELQTWAPLLLERLRALPQLRDVATDQQTGGLELRLALDRDTAARLGVTPAAIDDALYDAFGQRQVAVSYTNLNYYRVVLELRPELATGPDALSRLYVRGANGTPVPLLSVSSPSVRAVPLSITHQGQFPATTLSFNLAPGVALGQAVDAIRALELQLGLPASVRASFQGTAQAFQASARDQPVLIVAALFAVYVVLGILYESLVHPITILSTLPSAGLGALLALRLFGLDLSIMAIIGIILLIGIVKKNAILMIDFALDAERTRGLSSRESIREACRLRFRPILMTTFAALLGALPLALGRGTGAELRQPLGVAIVGGLFVSQLLTLFTTPVIYLALDRLSLRRRHRAPQPAPIA